MKLAATFPGTRVPHSFALRQTLKGVRKTSEILAKYLGSRLEPLRGVACGKLTEPPRIDLGYRPEPSPRTSASRRD
jgi:hypothetical protein